MVDWCPSDCCDPCCSPPTPAAATAVRHELRTRSGVLYFTADERAAYRAGQKRAWQASYQRRKLKGAKGSDEAVSRWNGKEWVRCEG